MLEAGRNRTVISRDYWRARAAAAVATLVFAFASPHASAASLNAIDLDARVACQMELEDLRWADMLWPASNPTPKPERNQVLTDAQIRERVLDRLRMEHALEALHGVQIKSIDLQAEMDRIARQSRDPLRLIERFEALDSDPYRIAECMVRPDLVRRELARRHDAARKRDDSGQVGEQMQFDAWWVQHRSRWSAKLPLAPEGLRLPPKSGPIGGPNAATADTWRGDHFPAGREDQKVLWTGTEMLLFDAFYEPMAGHSRYDPETDTWTAITWIGEPGFGRANYYLAVWTGSEVLIPGRGEGDDRLLHRYDPKADTWLSPIAVEGAPFNWDWNATLGIWSGSELLLVGAWDGPAWGSRVRPDTGEWLPMSTENAPSARSNASIVWSGDRLIIWGGGYGSSSTHDSGARYDPATDTWEPMTTVNAPTARSGHSAVWTESEMIVWGGVNPSAPIEDAGRYDPASDSWSSISTEGAPLQSWVVDAVWTGEEMIVLTQWENEYGRYTPATDSWAPITAKGAPASRYMPSMVWTGREVIVWGGLDSENPFFDVWAYLDTGARYDPAEDRWTPTASAEIDERSAASVVWTGAEMLVWAGLPVAAHDLYPNSGARYDPVAHAWQPMTSTGAPRGRRDAPAVWTGKEMFVWGGYFTYSGGFPTTFTYLDDGARYDPMQDTWTATAATGAPSPRAGHSAIWSGQEVVIWGGFGPAFRPGGARYDLANDRWLPISESLAPAGLTRHAAFWTGDEMIVWGSASGGRYTPESDSWSPINTVGAPSARSSRTEVWTGTELIIWGGLFDGTFLYDGARYMPSSDTWTSMATPDPAQARYGHSAVWTGSHMIVWGGYAGGGRAFSANGIAYDPQRDSWSAIARAPMAKSFHHAVWTGREMIAWGGRGHGGTLTYFPKSATRTRVVAAMPNPTMPGQPVRVDVHVRAPDLGPEDGTVHISAEDAGSCIANAPLPVDAYTATFRCDLVFNTLGVHRVDAMFFGSDTHYESDTLSSIDSDTSSLVTVVPMVEQIFADSFE